MLALVSKACRQGFVNLIAQLLTPQLFSWTVVLRGTARLFLLLSASLCAAQDWAGARAGSVTGAIVLAGVFPCEMDQTNTMGQPQPIQHKLLCFVRALALDSVPLLTLARCSEG